MLSLQQYEQWRMGRRQDSLQAWSELSDEIREAFNAINTFSREIFWKLFLGQPYLLFGHFLVSDRTEQQLG